MVDQLQGNPRTFADGYIGTSNDPFVSRCLCWAGQGAAGNASRQILRTQAGQLLCALIRHLSVRLTLCLSTPLMSFFVTPAEGRMEAIPIMVAVSLSKGT